MENSATLGKRYRYSLWRRLGIVPVALVLFGGIFIAFPTEPAWVLLFMAFLLAGVVLYALIMSYSLTLHADKIRVENFVRETEIPWTRIESYSQSGWGAIGYKLHAHNQGATVVVDAEIVDFPIVNEYIRQQTPQLWNDYRQQTISFNKLMAVGFAFMLVVLLAAALWFLVEEAVVGLLIAAFMLAVSAAVFLPLLRTVRSLSISGLSLQLQPMFGEPRTLAAEEIESIVLQAEPLRFGSRRQRTEYAVWLTLKNSQKIKLVYLDVGPAVLVNTLRNWWLAQSLPGARR